MGKKLSQFYGLGIYTEKAEYVGRVEDVILNTTRGEIIWLSLKSFKGKELSNEDIKQILQENSIPYTEVVQVGDIVICKRNPKKVGRKQEIRERAELR